MNSIGGIHNYFGDGFFVISEWCIFPIHWFSFVPSSLSGHLERSIFPVHRLFFVSSCLSGHLNFFSRKEFVTTLTELKAMAAEANMGFRRSWKKG